MQKTIYDADPKRGIVQVTTVDERWYMKSTMSEETGLPVYKAVPSVTWIAGFYPKGIGFYKWLSQHDWDESQAIMREAGDKGSKVHLAISAMLAGEEVRIGSEFLNKSTGQMEQLTWDEVQCLLGFTEWRASLESFEPLLWDVVVFSDKYDYAGSVDCIARVNGILTLIDFKTSQQVWPAHELQVSAYRETIENGENVFEGHDLKGMQMAILQVGYRLNKRGWKLNEVEDAFPLFLNAKAIWARETAGQTIKQRDVPMILSPKKKAEPTLKKAAKKSK